MGIRKNIYDKMENRLLIFYYCGYIQDFKLYWAERPQR